MKNNHLIIALVACLFCIAACRPTPGHTPTASSQYDSVMVTAVEEMHGAYYQSGGLEQNVVSLDLYSDGIKLNKKGYMTGTGTNLYFSDIFLGQPDSILIAGEYTSDTTGVANTFLPGLYYGGNFTGAYLLRVEDGQLTAYALIKEGKMVVECQDDSTFITFEGKLTSGKSYKAQYRGLLTINDAR